MIEQLASLLLPIEALLNHQDFDLHSNPSSELVSLFRSMWFLSSLFHFAMFEEKDQIAMNWVRQVLGKIASKTPAIVVEEAMDLVGELEYNTVLRREYAHTVCPLSRMSRRVVLSCRFGQAISKHRGILAKLIPLRSSEIRSLNNSEVVFLLTMHDLESFRSAQGLPSSLPSYFTNTDLNRNVSLRGCMESIAEKVIRTPYSTAMKTNLPSRSCVDLSTF